MSFDLTWCQSSPQTLNFNTQKDFSYINKDLGEKKIYSLKIFRGAGLRKQNNSM